MVMVMTLSKMALLAVLESMLIIGPYPKRLHEKISCPAIYTAENGLFEASIKKKTKKKKSLYQERCD